MTVIAVSGFGSIGRRHARVLSAMEGVEVVVHDPVALGEDVGFPVVANLDDLDAHRPDGIVIASPDEYHLSGATWAAERWLPVLLEKPVADTIAAAESLVTATAERCAVLVGYVLHHSPVFQAAAACIANGGIGIPISAHADLGAYETLVVARNRFAEPRHDRIFVDYSHEWDYLRWFLGPLTPLAAHARDFEGIREHTEHPNSVDALLRAGDVGVTAHLDYVRRPGRRVCTVIGSEASLTVDAGGDLTIRYEETGEVSTQSYAEPRDAMFARQAMHFLAVIRGEEEPAVTAADGLAALRTADALTRLAHR
ncbi:hypothetical protein ASD65_10350 [Microbacterium sp. Root61]|uniref:Gfo/Idh/MocA family protein n=1 Tax=Microbacterium sp. Root61 TaxID=1736570 RepID=UPI0006F62144|nr:Gfo/Idh/MocA family oxidoreductase [Microbacterium sp. Root61]KRA24778.1 hypothetical protein ASD65_10350 [Microbacterium sp. Root61]